MTKRKSTTFLSILELESIQTNNFVENDSSVNKSIRESDSTPRRKTEAESSSKETSEKKGRKIREKLPFDDSLLVDSSCSDSLLSEDDESG